MVRKRGGESREWKRADGNGGGGRTESSLIVREEKKARLTIGEGLGSMFSGSTALSGANTARSVTKMTEARTYKGRVKRK